MKKFIDTEWFESVDTFKRLEDGSILFTKFNENGSVSSGSILQGMTRSYSVQTGTETVVIGQDENGEEITENQPVYETHEFDVWAKFVELRDNGTITVQPVPQSELDAIAAEQAKQAERASKLNAFTFKGVSCSVNEADQNGWETVNARVKRLVAAGETWRDFPFFMDNGNHVLIESETEWDDFIEAGWAAREAIMMARLS
jgi:hypothetical protein